MDLRNTSPSFGQHFAIELSAENHLQLFIPKGFAHGFVVLSETALFSYKCDALYHPAAERGIMYNDPYLNIDWRIPAEAVSVSLKDSKHPVFMEAEMNF